MEPLRPVALARHPGRRGLSLAVALLIGYPCFRFRIIGHYFALVTLALSEVVRLVIVALRDYTGGSLGATPNTALAQGNAWSLYALAVLRQACGSTSSWPAGSAGLWIWARVDRSMDALRARGDQPGRGRRRLGRHQRHALEAQGHADLRRHDERRRRALRPVPDLHQPGDRLRHRHLAADGVRRDRRRHVRHAGPHGRRGVHAAPAGGLRLALGDAFKQFPRSTSPSTGCCWCSSSSTCRRASSARPAGAAPPPRAPRPPPRPARPGPAPTPRPPLGRPPARRPPPPGGRAPPPPPRRAPGPPGPPPPPPPAPAPPPGPRPPPPAPAPHPSGGGPPPCVAAARNDVLGKAPTLGPLATAGDHEVAPRVRHGHRVAEGVERGLGGRIDLGRYVRARHRVSPVAKEAPLLQHRDIAAVELAKPGEREGPGRAQLAGAERRLRPPQALQGAPRCGGSLRRAATAARSTHARWRSHRARRRPGSRGTRPRGRRRPPQACAGYSWSEVPMAGGHDDSCPLIR